LTLKPATPIPPILSSPQLDDIVGSSVEEEPVSVSVTTTSTSTAATPEVSIVVNNYKENNSKTDNEQHLQSSKCYFNYYHYLILTLLVIKYSTFMIYNIIDYIYI